jgi:hypothetical protein
MREYILAIKNHANQHLQYLPNNWVYFANQSTAHIIRSFNNDAYINAQQLHFFNVDQINVNIMRDLTGLYLEANRNLWTNTNNIRLSHHTDLLNNLEGCRTFCVLYTTII